MPINRAIQSSGGSSAIQIANTYQSSGGSSGFQSAFIGSSGRSGNQCAKDEDCLTFSPNLDNKTEIVECKTIPATASMPIQFECKKKKKVVSNKESSLTEILESRKMDYKSQNTDVTKLEIDGTPPPWPRPGVVRIILISDTHNKHRNLKMPPGDMLIHSGDFTNRGSLKAIQEFDKWLGELPYQHKVVVPGNHDTAMDPAKWDDNHDTAMDPAMWDDNHDTAMDPAMWDDNPHIHDIDEPAHISKTDLIKNAKVLINESVEMRGISIFGAPYTLDPFKLDWWAYKADTENDMEAFITMPTHSVDIVVTHSPPYGIGDLTVNGTPAGSKAVLNKVTASNPALHVFGHIHEAAGAYVYAKGTGQKNVKTNFINASSIPWTLKPIGPIVVDISEETKDVLNISRGLE